MEKRNNRFKYFFKTVLMNNLGYKVLSLVIAVMTWLVIINIADPITTRTFSGLDVNILNKSVITSINQVFEVVEGNTVDFTVKGKASVVKNLKLTDFSAYADLKKLSSVNATDISVKCDKGEGLEIDSGSQMLVVKLENVDRKNMQVSVEPKGEVADGYYVDDFEIKPNMITVSGGASKIKKVDSIKVIVDVAGAKKDFSQNVIPIAYDKDGNVVDSSYLTFMNGGTDVENICVNVSVYNTKTIPILIDISGEPSDNYVYEGKYEYSPETLAVGGASRKLSKVDSIKIPVDITDAAGPEYETSLLLSDYLPDGVKAVDAENKIAVRVSLEPVISKTIEIPVKNISFRNVPNDYKVSYDNESESISIELKGTKEQVDNFTSENVGAYINLDDAELGQCFLQVQFDKVNKEYIVSESRLVKVNVFDTSKPSPTQTPAPETSHIPEKTTPLPIVTEEPRTDSGDEGGSGSSSAGE